MGINLADFQEAVVDHFASLPYLSEDLKSRLTSGSLSVSLDAVREVVRMLASPAKVLVETNGYGDAKRCWADRPLELTMLRQGDDVVRPTDREDDMFIFDIHEAADIEAFAVRPAVDVAPALTKRISAAVEEHTAHLAWQRRVRHETEKGTPLVFRIEWLEGYDAREPEQHHASWFTPERGFNQHARNLLLAMSVGSIHDSRDVFDRVRITRLS